MIYSGNHIEDQRVVGYVDPIDKEWREAIDVTMYGMERIRAMASAYGLECDLEDNGLLEVAFNDIQVINGNKFL